MKDQECVQFLQDILPQLGMRWPGFRKVRRQVCKRITRRLRELDLNDLVQYRHYLEQHAAEWSKLDAMCRISISRFYRDRRVFDVLLEQLLPEIAEGMERRGEQQVRVWSAGCASGEEPHTVQLLWEFGVQAEFRDLSLQIVATDADPHMLERARHACYPASSFKDFPEAWLARAFYRSEDQFCLREPYRGRVEFLCQDIREDRPSGSFDVILCRHLIFTYFAEPLQEELLPRLLNKLGPDGVLMIGKQESLPRAGAQQLQSVVPHSGMYRRVVGAFEGA